ncbi:MAG: hypothetical protein FGM22_07355 [Burkholderiaceae bacterium]|nr:hypothetical protein [Burkholderiaceae bacterium]
MPRPKKQLSDNIEPNVIMPTPPVPVFAPTEEDPETNKNFMHGEIEDNATYEWGILVKDTATSGTLDTAPFTPTKIGNWQGGSLSWVGNLFRRTNRRNIKTFADFQAQNPLNLPTNKTFFFFRITVDKDGIRKRNLVHEGTFSDQKSQASTTPQQTGALSDGRGLIRPAGPNDVHPMPSTYEAKTLREALERTITDLQRELDMTRRERDIYREQNEKLRTENETNRNAIIGIEGERIRYKVEKEALTARYDDQIARLKEEQDREIDRLEQDHTRELADARQNAERAAIQTLNDGQSGYDKLMDSIARFVDKASDPRYAGMIDMVSKLATNFIPGMNGAGVGPQQGQLPPQQPMGATSAPAYPTAPYGQAIPQQGQNPMTGYEMAEAVHG